MSLIKEFAVEPEVMATWAHFNALWEDFGAERGRLISLYPALWKTRVDELAKQLSKPVRASAISAKIRRDKHKFLATGRNYSGEKSWLENATGQMALKPFHAIIAAQAEAQRDGVLVAGEFDKDEPPYQVAAERWVPRHAAALADSVRLLLENCEELRLVDPHFDPAAPRFKKVFQAMLGLTDKGALRRLAIHVRKPEPYKADVQEHNYRWFLADAVPKGLVLRIFFWSQKPGGMDMHARFVLTDLGGANFEHGLDEGEAGTQTLVKTLSHEVWQKCCAVYCQNSQAFALEANGVVEVQGSG